MHTTAWYEVEAGSAKRPTLVPELQHAFCSAIGADLSRRQSTCGHWTVCRRVARGVPRHGTLMAWATKDTGRGRGGDQHSGAAEMSVDYNYTGSEALTMPMHLCHLLPTMCCADGSE